MASWPDLTALKQTLGADRSDKDDLLEQSLGAAIEGVVADCGGSAVSVSFTSGSPTVDLVDLSAEEPVEIAVDDRLAAAALLRAIIIYKAPDAPFGVASTFDSGGIYVARYMPRYYELLKGHRQRFALS